MMFFELSLVSLPYCDLFINDRYLYGVEDNFLELMEFNVFLLQCTHINLNIWSTRRARG